ncbi:MAG: T9SS type A sorting domain-containing protein [Ignavibacteria bacterium]|nr:T9SS type A sorting domain-containing protein [Ignavibacteria bacterium]
MYDLYQGDVRLRVLSHEAQPGGIVWSIRQEMDVNHSRYNTPPVRISGVDTVRLLEIDSGRHELRVFGVNSRAGIAFPWNFPYSDYIRTKAEAVSLYRSYTGPPSYVFETSKGVGVGASICRIRFISNFGVDSLYTDGYTQTNYSITYRFRARLIGPAVDSVYLGMLHTEDSARRAIVDLGFALLPNYPNPVVGETSVAFSVPREAHVRIVIQDLFGRNIATIADGDYPFGRHAAALDASRLASGLYLIRMEAEGNIRVRSMVVRK